MVKTVTRRGPAPRLRSAAISPAGYRPVPLSSWDGFEHATPHRFVCEAHPVPQHGHQEGMRGDDPATTAAARLDHEAEQGIHTLGFLNNFANEKATCFRR